MSEADTSELEGSSPHEPVGVAVVGVGGYGAELIQAIDSFGPALRHPLRLTAVCDVSPARCAQVIDGLAVKGVRVHRSAQSIAENPEVDAAWLPLPIHLHAEYTAKMLAAGKAVMCEKPVAGSLSEVDDMIRARNAFGRPVLVGFQEIYEPSTYRLKQLLLSGQLGRVRRVTVRACWPRNAAYFTRNEWAGRRCLGNHPIHDSPLNNALAHYANLALFLAAGRLEQAAMPEHVVARTYRSALIENYDTAMVYARVDTGPDMFLWLTHACRDTVDPVMKIICDHGVVTRHIEQIEVERTGKPVECWPMAPRDPRPMLEALGSAVRGDAPEEQVWATLESARPHVALVEAVAESAVQDVPRVLRERVGSQHEQIRAIRGVADWFADLEHDVVRAQAYGDSLDARRIVDWLSLPEYSEASAYAPVG